MRRFQMPTVVLLLALLSACATTPRHEFDQQADFVALKTFRWLEPKYGEQNVSVSHPVLDSPLLGQRVKRAVIRTLGGRGYLEVMESPDFLVTYHTAEGEQQQRSGTYMSVGYGRFHPPFGGGVLLDMSPRSFKEGTLILDVVNARTGDLVWRGWSDAALTQRNFDEERINEAVSYILSAFPPGK